MLDFYYKLKVILTEMFELKYYKLKVILTEMSIIFFRILYGKKWKWSLKRQIQYTKRVLVFYFKGKEYQIKSPLKYKVRFPYLFLNKIL